MGFCTGGPHGYGVCNDTGTAFLSTNEAHIILCNTWFEKKVIYKQTWQHRYMYVVVARRWNIAVVTHRLRMLYP